MAIEGFLNFYGVVRLGDTFYTKHYERLGPVPKLATLLATCTGLLLSDDSDILKATRRLAEQRNRLVHPKTREVEPSRPGNRPELPSSAAATTAVADMDLFFKLFTGYDKDAELWIQMFQSSSLTRELELSGVPEAQRPRGS